MEEILKKIAQAINADSTLNVFIMMTHSSKENHDEPDESSMMTSMNLYSKKLFVANLCALMLKEKDFAVAAEAALEMSRLMKKLGFSKDSSISDITKLNLN